MHFKAKDNFMNCNTWVSLAICAVCAYSFELWSSIEIEVILKMKEKPTFDLVKSHGPNHLTRPIVCSMHTRLLQFLGAAVIDSTEQRIWGS
jgi:hypothetical protein